MTSSQDPQPSQHLVLSSNMLFVGDMVEGSKMCGVEEVE